MAAKRMMWKLWEDREEAEILAHETLFEGMQLVAAHT